MALTLNYLWCYNLKAVASERQTSITEEKLKNTNKKGVDKVKTAW